MSTTTTVKKILEKAALLEQQAAALRLAASYLNGEAHHQKRTTAAHTVAQAVKLRRAQQNGSTPHEEPEAQPAARKRLSKYARTKAERAAKRDQILTILRDYGKPMPIRELVKAVRAVGITSLTGIIGLAQAGYLKKSGARGKTRYTFRQMPEAAGEK